MILISSGNALGASVTVCDSGCDYTAIALALTGVGNGSHTITVQAPYTSAENITVSKNGANASSRLTIQGRAEDMITLKRLNITGNYITINNFRFYGLTSAYDGAVELNSSNYITITGCTFDGSGTTNKVHPIMSSLTTGAYPSNITIQDNVFSYNAYFIAAGGNTYLFQNNTITGNNTAIGDGIDVFYIWGDGIIIRNNEIKNMTDQEGWVTHTDIFQIAGVAYDVAKNIVIENNYIHDNRSQIFNLQRQGKADVTTLEFRNNIVKNLSYSGNIGMPNVRIYNNIFDNAPNGNSTPALTNILNFGVFGAGDNCDNADVRNNVFIARAGVSAAKYNIGGECSSPTANFNFVSQADGNTAQTAFNETNGVNGGDPNFISRATGNYRIGLTSVLKDKGTTITTFNKDMVGAPRPQGPAWDIGPYEYRSTLLGAPANFRQLGQ
jgi:hypothetical protein